MPKPLACAIYREYLPMSTSIYAQNHEKRADRPEEYPGDAQEACEFSLWMSKSSPVFHNVSVVATRLRASLRCTMVSLMPSTSETGPAIWGFNVTKDLPQIESFRHAEIETVV